MEYLNAVAARAPVPGGGSVAALAGAMATALISMVAHYSLGKGAPQAVERRIKSISRENEKIRRRFQELIDEDAEAYLRVVQARKKTRKEKRLALQQARRIPQEVCRLCYQAIQFTSYLVEKGNSYLLSDIEVALDMLLASYNSAKINVEINS